MAVDEAMLLESAQEEDFILPSLRFYGWDSPTLSVGRFQKVKSTPLLEKSLPLKVPVIRRPTGGQAVLHDNEITYSLILPLSVFGSKSSIPESHRSINEIFFETLQQLGIPVQWLSVSSSLPKKTPFCLASSQTRELGVQGKRIAGSAQVRKNDYLLQHGSILLEISPQLKHLFPEEEIQSVTGLKRFLPSSVTFQVLVSSFIQDFEKKFKIHFQPGELSEKEQILTETLRKTKYENPAWTFSR